MKHMCFIFWFLDILLILLLLTELVQQSQIWVFAFYTNFAVLSNRSSFLAPHLKINLMGEKIKPQRQWFHINCWANINGKGYLEAHNAIPNLHFIAFWIIQSNRAYPHRIFYTHPFIFLRSKPNISYTNFLPWTTLSLAVQSSRAVCSRWLVTN